MEIHWHNPDAFGEEERRRVEERIGKLAHGETDVIDVRIAARTTAHHRRGGHEVRITCDARGREIVAARTRADAALALNEAMDVFEREVRRMRDRRSAQRAAPPPTPPELGVVDAIFPDDGYGFILTDGGERVYFHRNAVHGNLAFERLAEGQRVGLNIGAGEKGPRATMVRPAPPHVASP